MPENITRQQYLENIIVGTLLESVEGMNYYEETKYMITPDMMQDETNRRIYTYIVDMNAKGMNKTTPCDIFEEYGEVVIDILPRMCELCNEYSFLWLKFDYNERRYLASEVYGVNGRETEVQFSDYVNQYVKMIFDGKTKN